MKIRFLLLNSSQALNDVHRHSCDVDVISSFVEVHWMFSKIDLTGGEWTELNVVDSTYEDECKHILYKIWPNDDFSLEIKWQMSRIHMDLVKFVCVLFRFVSILLHKSR